MPADEVDLVRMYFSHRPAAPYRDQGKARDLRADQRRALRCSARAGFPPRPDVCRLAEVKGASPAAG
jgi:hypothetical protein